jgi:hypothetical protein
MQLCYVTTQARGTAHLRAHLNLKVNFLNVNNAWAKLHRPTPAPACSSWFTHSFPISSLIEGSPNPMISSLALPSPFQTKAWGWRKSHCKGDGLRFPCPDMPVLCIPPHHQELYFRRKETPPPPAWPCPLKLRLKRQMDKGLNLVLLGCERRASCLQSRCSNTWATLPVHFALVCGDGVSQTICLDWPCAVILPISASQIVRITGTSYWHLAWCCLLFCTKFVFRWPCQQAENLWPVIRTLTLRTLKVPIAIHNSSRNRYLLRFIIQVVIGTYCDS